MEKKTFVPASAFSPSLHPSSSSFSSSSSPPPALSSLSSTSKGGGEGEEEEREEGEIVGEKSSEKSLQSNSHHACRECSLPFMGAGDAFPWISQLIKSLSFFILLASLLIYTTWHVSVEKKKICLFTLSLKRPLFSPCMHRHFLPQLIYTH
ncbi:hypothetical protein CSUI_006851, partial [Cystoisospora suis]